MTASRKSISSEVSLASSDIEKPEDRDTSETAERCTRVLAWLLGGVDERTGVNMEVVGRFRDRDAFRHDAGT